jgi:hypothetical protein
VGLCLSEGNSKKKRSADFYASVATFSVTLWEHLAGATVILWTVFKT